MSTSHRNGLDAMARHLAPLTRTASVLLLGLGTGAFAGPSPNAGLQAAFTTAVQAQVAKSDTMPTDVPPTIGWLKPPTPLAADPAQGAYAVARIQFKGLANSYCKLVVSATTKGEDAAMVPVPDAADYDSCKGVSPVQFIDLDKDGAADLVFQVTVQSNRYPADVAESLVFLNKRAEGNGFCYSSEGSGAVPPDARSPESIQKATQAALQRLHKPTFSCAPR